MVENQVKGLWEDWKRKRMMTHLSVTPVSHDVLHHRLQGATGNILPEKPRETLPGSEIEP